MLKIIILPIVLTAAACTRAPPPELVQRSTPFAATMPPMRTFGAYHGTRRSRPNAAIARDFLDLSFRMESGRSISRLSRFSEPILVAVAPGAAASLAPDLQALLARLRHEARIDIRRARPGESANITVVTVPHRELRRAAPQAACFVVPRISSWAEFRRDRGSSLIDWTRVRHRKKAAVFIPSGVSPQETRDCLHEEIAQALGPLDDLYRLPDSVYNDDNFLNVLTDFDMLILRATYSREMHDGMTREQAAAVLPKLLDRLNPAGRGRSRAAPLRPTPRVWIDAIQRALGPGTSRVERLRAAKRAVDIALSRGWNDNRLGFALFSYGRIAIHRSPDSAIAAFLHARKIFKSLYGNDIHTAHVTMHIAAFNLSTGQADKAISEVNEALPAARAKQNAALLASLLMIKAEALKLKGLPGAARRVSLDSLAWARYGFGSERAVRARLGGIAAIVPKRHATTGGAT